MHRLALLISAAATVVGVVLLQLYLQRFEQQTRGGPTTRVLVLTQDVAAFTKLESGMLATRELPPSCLESRHVLARDINEVLDARLAIPGRANETLLWTDLGSMREPERKLSRLVPEGMRAFTLGFGSSSSDSLIAPGDRVDVILVPRAELEGATPNLVAENLLVLAVGSDLGGMDYEREHSARANQITLSTTPDQAGRLAQAELRGSLRLALRNSDDIELTGSAEGSATRTSSASARRGTR